MIGIHVVHRRLAELTLKAMRLGGYHKLTIAEQKDLEHCLKVNASIVTKLDELKNLAFIAHCAGDTEWEQEICARIDRLEATII